MSINLTMLLVASRTSKYDGVAFIGLATSVSYHAHIHTTNEQLNSTLMHPAALACY
jgi:hypothetical protein